MIIHITAKMKSQQISNTFAYAAPAGVACNKHIAVKPLALLSYSRLAKPNS